MKTKACLLLLLLFATAISGWILLRAPYGGFPDEESHFRYAQYVRFHHALPPISFEHSKIYTAEGFQPPLYYFLASLLITDNQSASIIRVRILSLLFALLTIWIGWKAAAMVFGHEHPAVFLTTALMTTNAQFLFTLSGVTNMAALVGTCALVFYFALRGVLTDADLNRNALWMGICFGLALLSRTISAFLALICVASILWRSKDTKTALKALLFFAIPALLVASWWYLRNWIYYEDPLLWKLHAQTVGSDWVRKEPFTLLDLTSTLAILHASYWAYFGRNEYHAGIWEYAVYLLIEVMALWGFLEMIIKKHSRIPFSKPALWLVCLTAITGILEILWMLTKLSNGQGRYFFIALIPISMVFATGLLQIAPARFDQRKMTTGLIIFFASFCLYLLTRYYFAHI